MGYQIKLINQLPNDIKILLYKHKLECFNGQCEDLISMYSLILVDNVMYHSDDEFSNGMLKRFLNSSDEYRKAALPHAIIMGGKIIKNRYGHTTKL